MENVSVALQATTISGLQFAQFLGLRFVRVDWEAVIDEEIPDFLAALPRIKRFILRIAYAAELLVGRWRLRAVILTNELNDAFTLINLLPEQFSQIAAFCTEYILPYRLIAEKRQRVRHKLPSASKFSANRRDENERSGRHRGKSRVKLTAS